MVSEVHGLRIFLLGELDPQQKEEVLKFVVAQNTRKTPFHSEGIFKGWLRDTEKNLVFCAFLGSKVLGVAPIVNEYGILAQQSNMLAITPKSFVLKSNKTVGRILLEEIEAYGKRNKLTVLSPHSKKESGERALSRPARRLIDKPFPITRKASWRAKHSR